MSVNKTPAAWIGPSGQLMPHAIYEAWSKQSPEDANSFSPLYAGGVCTVAEPSSSPALVTALRGLLASLQREPTEFELRAAAHEFTVMADRAAAAARAGGDDA